METRKHVARKETAREGAYSLPVGFLVVGLVAIFLSNDEESMRDFVLRSKVLKWKVGMIVVDVSNPDHVSGVVSRKTDRGLSALLPRNNKKAAAALPAGNVRASFRW